MATIESDARTLGWCGSSIGTSLAFESIVNEGEFEAQTKEPAILKIDTVYINLRTLIRNAHNAFNTEDQPYITAEALIDAVTVDLESSIRIATDAKPTIQVKLYLCTYEGIDRKLKHVKFKNATTPKQLSFETLERGVISYYIENKKDDMIIEKYKLRGEQTRCVILTHLPFDLLSYGKFKTLTLLESHTGKLKSRPEWSTKLSVDKERAAILPFNLITLCIFGDGATISPQPIKIRRVLLSIGEKRKWHSMTSQAAMLQSIELAREPHLATFVSQYNVKL